jgi:hypothetical protein
MTDGTFTNRKRSERDKREKGKRKKIAFMLLLSTNKASFVPTVEQRAFVRNIPPEEAVLHIEKARKEGGGLDVLTSDAYYSLCKPEPSQVAKAQKHTTIHVLIWFLPLYTLLSRLVEPYGYQ